MTRRQRLLEIDPAAWPAFDVGALAVSERRVFAIRRQAIELYAAGQTIGEIEQRTGIDRRQLYRLLDRCVAPHEDGRPFGWRAAISYTHVHGYKRHARVALTRGAEGLGAAGAFGLLVATYPALAKWISDRVRAKKVSIIQHTTDDGLRLRVRGLKNVHTEFLRECRSLGLTVL